MRSWRASGSGVGQHATLVESCIEAADDDHDDVPRSARRTWRKLSVLVPVGKPKSETAVSMRNAQRRRLAVFVHLLVARVWTWRRTSPSRGGLRCSGIQSHMSKEEPLLLVVISVASVAASWRARGADPQHNFASSMYTASAPADVIAREIKSGTRLDSSGSGQVARCQVRGGLGTFGGNGGNCGPWGEAGGKWSV